MKSKIYILALLFLPFFVHGATLSILPASGSYSPGDVFQAAVYVGSPNESINAVQGAISFPATNLEVISLSKVGSIVGLWVQEPTFSNTGGAVNFEGVVLNPGFMGAQGKIVTITFRAKAAGMVPVSFSSGSVLANDGQGTNVLKGFSGATFVVGDSQTKSGVAETTSALGELGTPSAPVITSPTHPDPTKWYTASDVIINWGLPRDATAVRYAFDHGARTIPSTDLSAPLTSKRFTKVADGIWYMHVRIKNTKGWGAVSHFRVAIDTVPPEAFKITFPHGEQADDPRPVIYFNTTDKGSGIAHYNVKVGENDLPIVTQADISSNPYAIPPQLPGNRTILVQAVDKAGNMTTETGKFEIQSIEPPKIVDFSSSIREEDIFRVRGTTYSGATVHAYLKDKNGRIETETTKSTDLGDFGFIWATHLDPGVYTVTFDVVDARGATSILTEPLSLEVNRRVLFAVGSLVVNYLSLGLFLVFCIGGVLFLGWYAWNRIILFRTKLRRDLHNVEHDFHKAFALLAKDFEEEIKNLEGVRSRRELTSEEERIIKKMRQNLHEAEEFLETDIHKIEEKL